MTPWQWWAGELGDVDNEGSYSLGDFDTRQKAISEALREFPVGAFFYVVEARSSEAMKYEGAEIVPFLRQRNKELLQVGRNREAIADQVPT